MRLFYANIERQLVARLPDQPRQKRNFLHAFKLTVIDKFDSRSHRPVVRPFQDGAEEDFAMSFPAARRTQIYGVALMLAVFG